MPPGSEEGPGGRLSFPGASHREAGCSQLTSGLSCFSRWERRRYRQICVCSATPQISPLQIVLGPRKRHFSGILKWLLVTVFFWARFSKCANKFHMSSFVLLSLGPNLHARTWLPLLWVNPLFSLEPVINDWTLSLPICHAVVSYLMLLTGHCDHSFLNNKSTW